MKKMQKLTALAAAVILAAMSAVSVSAITEVRCIGGGGTKTQTHKFGLFWLKSHEYTEMYHDVDRVYDGYVYGTSGHEGSGCSTEDYYSYCEPGTVVGEAP